MTDQQPAPQPTLPNDSTEIERWKRAAMLTPAQEEAARLNIYRKELYRKEDISSYANFLFGSAGTLDRPAWSDTTEGRAAIRFVSRGLVGTLAFALGGHFAQKQMQNYDAATWRWDHTRPLQAVAKLLDIGPAALIRQTGRLLGASERTVQEATRFRNKAYFFDTPGHQPGRSYGAEVTSITMDFFCASIGDALARNVIQAFDPNVKQPWLLDKDGNATTADKGKFDAGNWWRALGRSTWRILTKNAGEDWAAGLVYVYQMKWQRQAISRIGARDGSVARNMLAVDGRGFKLSADPNLNGALALVHEDGTIGGGYQWQGALDLQSRFMGYNWYTLMYREGYDAVGRAFTQWKNDGFKLQLPAVGNPIEATIDGLGNSVRYVAKSFIKSMLYMAPAVVPFWMFRTPQSKRKGFYAVDDLARGASGDETMYNAYVTTDGVRPLETQRFGALEELIDPQGDPLRNALPRYHYRNDTTPRPTRIFGGNKEIHFSPNSVNCVTVNNPYAGGVHRNWFDHMLNPFGHLSFVSGRELGRLVDHVTKNQVGPISNWLFKGSQNKLLEREKFIHNAVDAAYAYTPYMWLKAETALRVDDRKNITELGQMDTELYGALDSLFTFNLKSFGQHAAKVLDLSWQIEREVKSREGGAKANETNTTPTRIVAGETITREPSPVPPVPTGKIEKTDDDRRWAEDLMGRRLDAHYQPANATRH